MSYQTLYNQRQAFTGTDAEFIAFANEMLYTPRPYECGLGQTRITLGKEKAAAIRTFLASAPPAGAGDLEAEALYIQGRIDMSLPETQGMLDALVAGGLLTAAEGEKMKDLGRVGAKRCAAWGFEAVTEADLTKAALVNEYDNGTTRQAVYGILDKYNAAMAKLDQLREAGTSVPTFAELEAML